MAYLVCALLLSFAAAPAHADRVLESEKQLQVTGGANPPPEGEIEGACGLAISSSSLYVSDYYHRLVDIFSLGGSYQSQFALAGENPVFGINALDSVCGLAFDSSGRLYANEFHEKVLRLKPSVATIDEGESTGVAVDGAGNLYVNDRTYVAKYEAPVEAGDEPVAKIGLGTLEDGYGLAVFGGKVYVPDAASDTVKVYESTGNPLALKSTIADGFTSLVDAAVAVDPTNGHLLVVDNSQPGYEHPKSAIYEFDSAGAFLGKLPGAPVFGEPSGIAVDASTGDLYVTTGNSEQANVFKYGPYTLLASPPPAPAGGGAGAAVGGGAPTSRSDAGSASSTASGSRSASASVVVQRRGVRVSFDGKLTPHALPRHGMGPVGIVVDAKIAATGGDDPPQLRRISIAINRNGQFSPQGLPVCRLDQIQPSTTDGALAACGRSLVGEGRFSANVKLPQQSPFPSNGKVLAFNGRINGKAAILAHIYGTQPAPTSTVLPFLLRNGHGTYGTTLEASLPQATGSWGYVTGLRMSLRRRFTYRGKSHSYLSAGCPAPAGFRVAAFPLARTSFAFAGSLTLVSVLNQTCQAQG